MKKSMKKMITIISASVLALALAIGGTYAWFTSESEAAVGKVKAGNLKVALTADLETKDTEGNDILYYPGDEFDGSVSLANASNGTAIVVKLDFAPENIQALIPWDGGTAWVADLLDDATIADEVKAELSLDFIEFINIDVVNNIGAVPVKVGDNWFVYIPLAADPNAPEAVELDFTVHFVGAKMGNYFQDCEIYIGHELVENTGGDPVSSKILATATQPNVNAIKATFGLSDADTLAVQAAFAAQNITLATNN